MHFFKMNNIGNDYIYTFSPFLSTENIKKLCDRHFGIGGDGVVQIYKKNGLFGLEIFNSDGSYATFCGNATMSLGWYLYKRKLVKSPFKLHTGGGIVELSVIKMEKGEYISLTSSHYNFFMPENLVSENVMINREMRFKIGGKTIKIRGTAIDVFNLHFVIFGNYTHEVCEALSEKISSGKYFPCGVNIEFVSLREDGAHIRVFERGSGETLACGSGLFATAFTIKKLYKKEGMFLGHFKGGKMIFKIAKDSVTLFSQPEFLFEGEFNYGYKVGL